MKIYILIYEEDSDNRCGADVLHYTTEEAAVEAMREKYRASLEKLDHNVDEQTEDYNCSCKKYSANIVEAEDGYYWRVEAREIELPVPHVAVEVSVDVYDLDVSDYPDNGEEDEAQGRKEQLREFRAAPGVREVW